MTIQLRILFTVTISHNYYSQGCRDFIFIIPADTAQLLKSGKLIAKVREDKLYVLFEADETDTALFSIPGKTLRIGLKLLNPFFSNFTDLDFDFNSSRPLYKNFSNPDALDAAQAITLVGKVFSHSLADTERPVTVTLKDSKGQVLQTDTITGTNDRLTVSYELTGQVAGTYSVEEFYSENTKTTAYYSDAELQGEGIFGVIEIKIDSTFYTRPPEFALSFAAKQETLKYYVVAKNYSKEEFKKLSVVDGQSQINFIKVPHDQFTPDDNPYKLLVNSNAQIALFKSQAVVMRQEKALQKIQLQKNGEVLIPHLPQPGVNKANSDMIVQLAKPKP